MTAWDAARAASKRPLRKAYKPVAPVGAKLSYYDRPCGPERQWLSLGDPANTYDALGCRGCGYHVCSCGMPDGLPAYNFPERSPREHGQTAPDISSGTAFTLKPAAEFVPHAYMRMGTEFRWGHRIYVNPNDPRVRGSAPSKGP